MSDDSACTSRSGGVARRGETRETEQRHRRRRCRRDEEKEQSGKEWVKRRIEIARGLQGGFI